MSRELASDLRRQAKIVLHDHLDGGLRPGTVVELAETAGHRLPVGDPDGLARWIVESCTGRGLSGYGEAFSHTVAVMQTATALQRVAREAIEDHAFDGVIHAELRFAPTQHTRAGLSADAVLEAVLDGLTSGAHGRDISVALIVCAMRSSGDSLAVADLAVRWADRGVVALDLAGPESAWPAAMHRDAFLHARRSGLRVTVHAGEDAGLPSIEQALHLCGAERIGHGVRIVDDIGHDGRLGSFARLVRDRAIPLEVCPTSNVQTGVAASLRQHAAARLLELGFVVTINPDNRLMSAVTPSEELAAIATAQDWPRDWLSRINQHAAEAAFVDPWRKAELRRAIAEAEPGQS